LVKFGSNFELSSLLNDKGIKCPHPKAFIETGLRSDGQWVVADVEMAISSYVDKLIKGQQE
jgi:hypothetical protein